MSTRKPSSIAIKIVATFAVAALSLSAFAGRYWLGGATADESDNMFGANANWNSKDDGSGDQGKPGSGTSTTYFYNYRQGLIVFDETAAVENNVYVATASESPFAWKAVDASFGIVALGKELDVDENSSRTPTWLKIESGSYSFQKILIGKTTNSRTTLTMDGGVLETGNNNPSSQSDFIICNGSGETASADVVVNGGRIFVNGNSLYVGYNGRGSLTINNGGVVEIRDTDSYGLSFGHNNSHKRDTGTLVLNEGGTLITPRFRSNMIQEGSRAVFNGGTLKATRNQDGYIATNPNLTCVLQSGGLVVDTVGYNVGIAHEFTGSGPLIKKGAGTLTVADASKFTEVIVYEGTAVVGGTTYTQDAGTIGIDVSEGGSYGPYALHGNKLESWLEAPLNFTHFSSSTANGTASYEMPESLTFSVGSEVKNWTNLKTGETYEDTLGGVEYSFTTKALAPRTIRIDAPDGTTVANVRDVGSWPLESLNGKKMNQDVLFRGASLDAFTNATAYAKSESFLSQIGLKTEIELRLEGLDLPDFYSGVTASFAADDCEYVNCGMAYNGGPQLDSDNGGNFTNMIRKVFSTWGTAGKLPSYFHCRIGRDRTGMVGLLVLGLMGVEEEVLYRDYLLSNFAKLDSSLVDTPRIETCLRYLHRGNCNDGKYVYSDNTYGRSVAARCRAYLEMCGVTSEEIANITHALSWETPSEVLERVDAYETANNFRTVSYVPYEGASETNAMHRLAAGQHILPTATPSREGWSFGGWDTDNEIDTGDGTAVVYAKWTVDKRYWADSNGESAKFASPESWTPSPASMESAAGDTFVLNKGENKVAVVDYGDYVTVGKLSVGQGENNQGGWLDVAGGSLNVTGDLVIGDGTGASSASNIVMVTDGTVSANKLYVGKSGKGEFTLEGGSLVLDSGNGDITLCDGANDEATVNFISGQVVYHQLNITQNGGRAVVNIGKDCTVDAGWATYAGANSEFNIYGEFLAHPSVNLGNKTGGPSVINLCGDETKRGLLRTAEIVARSEGCMLNWNGGRLMRKSFEYIGGNDILPLSGGQPTSASPLTVVVGENGAYFESLDDKANDSISKPLSGAGAFVKLGGGTLTLKGAVNLKGGFKVENGILNVENVARTSFKTIELAAGASLNLNEAEVTVERYVVGGNEYGPGRYAEQNGLIVVAPPAVGAPETAVWLNSLGDSDLNNPDNWMVKNSEGQVLADALPDSNTEVFVYAGVQRPDFTGLAVKSVFLVAEQDTYLRGIGCTPPDIVKAANGWYDFDDSSTVVLSDETSVSRVRNKGSDGETLDAEAFGKANTDPAPLYGVNNVYGRNVMSLTTSDSDSTRRRGLQTAELGLTNNQDRAIIAVSRRGSGDRHYPVGIERQDNTSFNPEHKDGHFRIQHFPFATGFLYCDAKSSSVDGETGAVAYEYDGKVIKPSPEQKFVDWTVSLFQSEGKDLVAMMYSDATGLSSKTATAIDLNTQQSERLYIGHARFNENDANRGQIGEVLYYDHALTSEQIDSIYAYLKAKWLTPGDVSNMPSNILLENGATLDFGGGNWRFDTIKGAGTIGTANVTVTGSLDAGLTVGGTVTFAEGATIDISCFDKTPVGSEVVFLTADSIENWPRKVKSRVRMSAPRLVNNQDGTVSLVGKVAAIGLGIRLR